MNKNFDEKDYTDIQKSVNVLSDMIERKEDFLSIYKKFNEVTDKKSKYTVNSHNSSFISEDFMKKTSNIPGFHLFSYYLSPKNGSIMSPFELEIISSELSAASFGVVDKNDIKNRFKDSEKIIYDDIRKQYIDCIKSSSDSTKKLIFIDIETTSFTPLNGEIIEYAYLVTDLNGNILEEKECLCGVEDSTIHSFREIPTEDITGIKYEFIKNSELFNNSKYYKNLEELLLDDNYIIVAHNASFEDSWFSFNVPGYFEKNHPFSFLRKDFGKVIDTKFQSKILDMQKHNRLQDFSKLYGIDYKNAHRAINDVNFMYKAFFKSREFNAKKEN